MKLAWRDIPGWISLDHAAGAAAFAWVLRVPAILNDGETELLLRDLTEYLDRQGLARAPVWLAQPSGPASLLALPPSTTLH